MSGRWRARIENRIGVWLYRTFDGRLSSGGKSVHVLLLTSPGRRTGRPRSICVRFVETSDGLVVWGTGAGSPRDPDWFQNLRRAPGVDVQVRGRRFHARPRELLGDERTAMWRDVVLVQAPGAERYARKARRTIPVAVLHPAEAPGPS